MLEDANLSARIGLSLDDLDLSSLFCIRLVHTELSAYAYGLDAPCTSKHPTRFDDQTTFTCYVENDSLSGSTTMQSTVKELILGHRMTGIKRIH
jgi:hypothetical protein